MPELSLQTLSLIRILYAVLMLLTFVTLIPNFKIFFFAEKWGGYAENTKTNLWLHRPLILGIIFLFWTLSLISLVTGKLVVLSALLNAIFCYQFFIRERWNSLLRGFGAPGFMAWWVAMAVLVLEFTNRHAPSTYNLATLLFQVDFAIVMLSAGIYKATAGYLKGDGFELGLANPMWSYWWRIFSKIPPGNPIFYVLNQFAWALEVIGATLMFFPKTRLLGGAILFLTFVVIMLKIRLNLLTQMVMISCFLFIPAKFSIDIYLTSYLPLLLNSYEPSVWIVGPETTQILTIAFWAYIILRPIILGFMYMNFYLKKQLPSLLQKAVDKYANIFGIILWRVFTFEIINFFIEIRRKNEKGEWVKVSSYGNPLNFRFNHVGEAITVATIFTAIKYFPGKPEIFNQRILRYVDTLPKSWGKEFQFTYISISKGKKRFDFIPACQWVVNRETRFIGEAIINIELAPQKSRSSFASQQCITPGSYAPSTKPVLT